VGPNSNDSYTLGSTSLRWADLYLGPDTLHIGSSTTDEGLISYNTTNNILNFSTDSTSNGDIAFFSDDLYLDKSSGNVGIGTTSPLANLHVIGNAGSTNNKVLIIQGSHDSTGKGQSIDLIAGTDNDQVHTPGDINLTGGSASWGEKTGGHIYITGGTGGDNDYAYAPGDGGNVYINGGRGGHNDDYDYGPMGNVLLATYSGGKVGIGTTSPSTLLQLGTAGTTAGTLGIAGSTSGLVTLQTAAAAGTWS
jgi:hypothetical protein